MKKLFKVLTGFALSLSAISSFAASDTIFAAGVTSITTILTGTGGVLISLVAVVAAVVAGATGNLKTALTALGVAILASVGPNVATSFFTAVL